MRRSGVVLIHALVLAMTAPARADPVPLPEPPPYDWRGAYVGFHAGGALNLADVENPFGASIFGDTVRTPGFLAGAQAGYNWQFQSMLLGLEADVSWADMDGTNTCLAYSGFFLSSNCTNHVDALGTLTGRIGWAPGDGLTLLYGKAGLAWDAGRAETIVNGGLNYLGTRTDLFRFGYTLGAGVERAVSPRWSLKAEYDFIAFSGDIGTAASGFQAVPDAIGTLVPVGPSSADLSQDMHVLRIGMNYRLWPVGPAPATDWGGLTIPPSAAFGTSVEVGARYVRGWGQFHKDLGIPGQGVGSLASRLTYGGMSTNGAELFARLDAPFNLMTKGLLGTGSGGGHMNDEDWGLPSPPFAAFVPYSNTISGVDNDVRYALIDVGYDLWRGRDYSVAPFLGYSYFKQEMKGFGCTQIANPNSDCGVPVPGHILVITETDEWQSLRLGAAAQIPLAPYLKLSAEAAYLPYVSFTGTDDHTLRTLLSPEDGHGAGVQLEAMLTYAVTDDLSLGLGGRYWSLWTTDGIVNFGGAGIIVPMRYSAEQAAVLLQASYTFDGALEPK